MSEVHETLSLERAAAEQIRFKAAAFDRIAGRFPIDLAQATEPSHARTPLPSGAEGILRFDHPRLVELRDRYRASGHGAIDPAYWNDSYVQREIDLRNFRGDYAYVWQNRDLNLDFHYTLTACYSAATGTRGWLRRLSEDGLFGAYTYQVNGLPVVSRDLLDSLQEIGFLERHLGLSARPGFRLLDIGAGYGRLAHRLAELMPDLGCVLCTDAVELSTFLCEYYLDFRGVSDRARTVPLDELERVLSHTPVDIATNIHSFSECTLVTVKAWLEILARHEVRYLMIAPNLRDNAGTRLLTIEHDGGSRDFLPEILAHGYRLVVSEPKYLDPVVQRYGVTPGHYFLFERR